MDIVQILNGTNADEIINIANHYYDSQEKEERDFAIKIYERVVELEPMNPFALNRIGNCYINGFGVPKDESKAKDYYSKAANMGFPASLYNLAEMLLEEGNPECINLFEKSTKNGDGEGYYKIAEIYRDGTVAQQNDFLYIQYLEKAVDLNFTSAMLDLSVELLNGKIVPANIEKGIRLMILAANAGSSIACNNMAKIFRNGKFLPRNMEDAIYWAKRASELNEHEQIIDIAYNFFVGEDDLPVNKNVAVELFKFAAENGSVVGMENLAICYNKGDAVPQNPNLSKDYFIKAAHLGSEKAYKNLEEMCGDEEYISILKSVADDPGYYSAMIVLYHCYSNGTHVIKDEQIAKEYLNRALDGEYSEAYLEYGNLRYFGELGYSEDVNEAIKYWEKASNKGYAKASHNLGLVFSDGKKIEKDETKARTYFELAASQGYCRAYIDLGDLYNTTTSSREDLIKAINYYEKAFQSGIPEGAHKIGCIYDSDNAIETDYSKAASYFAKAKNQGYLESQSRLGALYYYGVLGQREAEKGIDLLQDAINKGYKPAESFLSPMYYIVSDGVDSNKAFQFNYSQAQKGNADAQYMVSYAYENGLGVQQNSVEAQKWRKIAADNGETTAQGLVGLEAYDEKNYAEAYRYLNMAVKSNSEIVKHYLAMVILEGGYSVPNDINRAINLLTEAANQGFAPSQSELGIIYAMGEKVPQNMGYAINLFTKAAEQGDDSAQKNLGIIYKNGNGVPTNPQAAVYWFSKAAEQGNIQAKSNLADMYKMGIGVQRNYNVAINLLKEVIDSGVEDYYQGSLFDLAFIYSEINRDDLALPLWQQLAYLGNSTAQYNLGLCYAQGKGTNVDLNQARYWWQKAADQGDADARRQLANMQGRRW